MKEMADVRAVYALFTRLGFLGARKPYFLASTRQLHLHVLLLYAVNLTAEIYLSCI